MNEPPDRGEVARTVGAVFAVGLVGCLIAFALWLRTYEEPTVTVLGAGDQLSILVADGPARLLLATGDEPMLFENAFTRVRPIFARRVDVLLVAGAGATLHVPVQAHADAHIRETFAVAPLPPSAEADALGAIEEWRGSRQITVGPSVSVLVETALPAGADPTRQFPLWRMTIARGNSRIVVVSDAQAAAVFPPGPAAAVLVVSGADPAAAWERAPAVALVANAEQVDGPALRGSESVGGRAVWTCRVFPGEALRLRFVSDGVAVSSDEVQPLDAGSGR